MYRKLGIKDRILIDFFGWVTGIRILNPSSNHTAHEKRAIAKGMHGFYDEGVFLQGEANLMDGGCSIH